MDLYDHAKTIILTAVDANLNNKRDFAFKLNVSFTKTCQNKMIIIMLIKDSNYEI